jgi:hypothetical protein
VWLVLALFASVALDAIRHTATYGQDFAFHDYATHWMLAYPGQWFVNSTSRPLLYWIGGFCVRFTHDHFAYCRASDIFVLLAVVALKLLHSASVRVLRAPLLRISAIAFLAFLPVTVITTVVYASDTLALLPFVATGWSLVLALEASSKTKAAGYYGLCGLALLAGNFSKATFGVLPAAVIFVIAVACLRTKTLAFSRLWMPLLFCVAIPLATSSWLQAKNRVQLPNVAPLHHFNWHGTGEMTFRSLLGVRKSDVRIFDAPGYWDQRAGPGGTVYPLLEHNGYSYAALLQLGLFTDVMNITNPAHLVESDAPRPPSQLAAARRAVRFGLLFSVPALLAVAAFSLNAATSLISRHKPFPMGAFVWYSLAMAWFLPLVLVLPFVVNAYDYGYWLPRLTLPAIWIFFIFGFIAADRMAAKTGPALQIAIIAAVCLQSALGVQSLFG